LYFSTFLLLFEFRSSVCFYNTQGKLSATPTATPSAACTKNILWLFQMRGMTRPAESFFNFLQNIFFLFVFFYSFQSVYQLFFAAAKPIAEAVTRPGDVQLLAASCTV
jgi:hypothetical protein